MYYSMMTIVNSLKIGRGQRISEHLPLPLGEGWGEGLARIGNTGLF